MRPEDLERWQARSKDTKARFGIELPIVDYEDPELRRFIPDEDALTLFVVEQFRADLNAFELIVEAAAPGRYTVLFAGMTNPPGRRFLEWRLVITEVDDRDTHGFTIDSREKVLDRSDLVRINVPRWSQR